MQSVFCLRKINGGTNAASGVRSGVKVCVVKITAPGGGVSLLKRSMALGQNLSEDNVDNTASFA